MYKKLKLSTTDIKRNTSYEGEPIEHKINRIVNNKEPIKDGAPQIFTERKDGVRPEYDIRTDRFEVAVEAMDTVSKAHIAKRQSPTGELPKTLGEQAKEGMKKEGGDTPINTSDGSK